MPFLTFLSEDENLKGNHLRHTLYPGVYVLRAYVFRPINTKQEAQVAGLNATPSLEGGISSTVSDL